LSSSSNSFSSETDSAPSPAALTGCAAAAAAAGDAQKRAVEDASGWHATTHDAEHSRGADEELERIAEEEKEELPLLLLQVKREMKSRERDSIVIDQMCCTQRE
jgi:hypothetical protein